MTPPVNNILSKLAKEDTVAMNYRTDIISGSDIALKEGSDGLDLSGEGGGKDHGELSGGGEGNIGEGESDGIGPGNEAGNLPGGDPNSGDQFGKDEDPFSDNLIACVPVPHPTSRIDFPLHLDDINIDDS